MPRIKNYFAKTYSLNHDQVKTWQPWPRYLEEEGKPISHIWKPWIMRRTQIEKLMIGVKKSTFFSPPNTWIINKNFFPEKQAHEEIIGDF